jgi:hypothetical protein
MRTENRSALHTLIGFLTDAELHELMVTAQTELLNRPSQQDGLTVEVVTAEEAALVALYRRLPPEGREWLRTTSSAYTGSRDDGVSATPSHPLRSENQEQGARRNQRSPAASKRPSYIGNGHAQHSVSGAHTR